ncbi:microfibril-associated glycoprotein 4-like isoform X2 [Pseudophryne corroboree]|uniref:microfibril-associated glycoprotein 4-like isoform X2 n=1 Tax=Pseudophryne corroboree TaxID=495146 RepID=UPI003081A12F
MYLTPARSHKLREKSPPKRGRGLFSSAHGAIFLLNSAVKKAPRLSPALHYRNRVFQRRLDGSVDFQKPWLDYVNGFGNADGEYWLGLQNIYLLTVDSDCELRVDLEDCAGRRVSALYSNFSLSRNALNPESDGYRLYVGAVTDGGAGDALAPHVEHMFSTFDKDQDEEVQNCAEYWGGGFWYHAGGCAGAGLNARYKATGPLQNAFSWTPWVEYPETLRASQMKMRRVPDSN